MRQPKNVKCIDASATSARRLRRRTAKKKSRKSDRLHVALGAARHGRKVPHTEANCGYMVVWTTVSPSRSDLKRNPAAYARPRWSIATRQNLSTDLTRSVNTQPHATSPIGPTGHSPSTTHSLVSRLHSPFNSSLTTTSSSFGRPSSASLTAARSSCPTPLASNPCSYSSSR